MSTQTDKIRSTLQTLADVADVNNWPMIKSQATEALSALSELEAHPPAQEVVEAGNAMRKYVQDHGWSKRERMDPQSEIFRLVSAWDAALASQPKEVAPTVEPVAIRRQRTASPTVDLIVEVRDSILRLMGYGVDMPTVEEIIIDLAKPTRP